MLKFLIIMIILIYVIYRVGLFFFKILFITASNAQRQQRTYGGEAHKKAPNSNLNIDYVERESSKSGKKGYEGGEYVDYEEVKD